MCQIDLNATNVQLKFKKCIQIGDWNGTTQIASCCCHANFDLIRHNTDCIHNKRIMVFTLHWCIGSDINIQLRLRTFPLVVYNDAFSSICSSVFRIILCLHNLAVNVHFTWLWLCVRVCEYISDYNINRMSITLYESNCSNYLHIALYSL